MLALSTWEILRAWSKALIHLIFKGGDKDPLFCSSYRAISLISIVSKVYEQILLNRAGETYAEDEKLLPNEQAGFRKGRSGPLWSKLTSFVSYWTSTSEEKSLHIFVLLTSNWLSLRPGEMLFGGACKKQESRVNSIVLSVSL
jgi:hypothetical protein